MEDESCYETQLKTEFDRCDSTSSGRLSRQELTVLCQNLQLEAQQRLLLETLLGDHVYTGVNFQRFKNVLVSVLSGTLDLSTSEDDSSYLDPVLPQREVKPKLVRGAKSYGRRSCPDHESDTLTSEEDSVQDSTQDPSADVPRAKVRRSMSLDSVQSLKSEEEDGGRWGDTVSDFLSEGSHQGEALSAPSEGGAALQALAEKEKTFSLEELQKELRGSAPFCSSTPARDQLRGSTRAQAVSATPSLLMATVGHKVLSRLDEGSGFTTPDRVVAVWVEEGIQNSQDILQTLDFSLDEPVSLTDLTMALDNELLVSGNGIHQAALISYKSELQHLQVQVEQACRQKDKMKLDLEAAESRILQLVREVDDRQANLETLNQSRLREIQQNFRERLSTQRLLAEQESDALLQQLETERRHLQDEVSQLKVQEGELQEELSCAIQDKRHLQEDLYVMKQKLNESEILVSRLQRDMEQLLQHKFGGLDPAGAVLTHEERFSEIVKEYELQCRELRDRNDELSSELDLMRSQRSVCRVVGGEGALVNWAKQRETDLDETEMKQSCSPVTQKKLEDKPVSSVSLQTELALEQLQEKHQQEVKDLRAQLETQVNYYERSLELMRQNVEVERKDVAQTFKLEITELEDQKAEAERRALDLKKALDSLQVQIQHGGRSWSPEQERSVQRERADMEQNFAREISNLVQQLSSEKEQLEAELKLKMDQEVMLVRIQLEEARSDNSALQERTMVLQQQLVALEEDMVKKRWRLEELQQDSALKKKDEEGLLKENSSYREEVMSLSSRNLQLGSQNTELSRRLHEEQESALVLQRRLDASQEEQQENGAEIQGLQDTLQQQQNELRDQQEVWTLQRRHLEDELGKCRNEVKRLTEVEAELVKVTLKVKQMENAAGSRSDQVESLQRSLLEAKTREEDLQARVQAATLSQTQRVKELHVKEQELVQAVQAHERTQEELRRQMLEKTHLQRAEEQATLASAALSVAQQEDLDHREQLVLLRTRLQEEQEKTSELQEELRRSNTQSRSQMNLTQEQNKMSAEMQQRMEDLEVQLKGVQLVLQEKVQQLKDQLLKNGVSCSRLKELYVENSQLMVALQVTEKRQKDAEKQNFLLEDKVHALNELLKDLVMSTLAT